MSHILKGKEAESQVFAFQPQTFRQSLAQSAKDFLQNPLSTASGFILSEIVSQNSGISEIKRKELERQIESDVLDRVKSFQEEAYKKAYDLGFEEGLKKAFEEKSQDIQVLVDHLKKTLQEMSEMKTTLLKQNEVFFVKLLFQVASRLAMKEISESKEPLFEYIKSLVESAEKDDRIVVKLSTADYEALMQLTAEKFSAEEQTKIKLVASSDIENGGCFIETNFGSIDASLKTRVEKMWEALAEKLPNLDTPSKEIDEN